VGGKLEMGKLSIARRIFGDQSSRMNFLLLDSFEGSRKIVVPGWFLRA
jgi:hypothetical protein